MSDTIYHYTYLVTNTQPLAANRYYIGVRSCSTGIPEYDNKYMSSCKTLLKDIKIQGVDKFEKIVIETFESREKAIQHEIQLHNEYEVNINTLFYNKAIQTSVGFSTQGSKHTDGTRAKMSQSMTGIPKRRVQQKSKETRRKISKTLKGGSHTDASKHKMSISKTGHKNAQFGKCWISFRGLGKSKMIVKALLPHYIDQGWYKGAKQYLK